MMKKRFFRLILSCLLFCHISYADQKPSEVNSTSTGSSSAGNGSEGNGKVTLDLGDKPEDISRFAGEANEGMNKSRWEKTKAKDISEILDSLDYPELQVVPRASERLRLEAKEESQSWFVMHWPIELSGLATLGIGIQSSSQQREGLDEKQKTDSQSVALVTQAVGAGWLLAGVFLGMQKPYSSGYSTIARLNGKDQRSVLLRERLAEEALEQPARIMGPLKIASVISNFSLNVLMATYLTDQGRIAAGVSAILAFLPVIFEDHTIRVYEKHLEYKKKIYGPLTSTSVGYDRVAKAYYPMATLQWSF